MIKHTSSIEINLPVSDVFAFVSTIENIPKWQSEVVTTRVTTTGSLRSGTRFEEVVKVLGKQVPTVCEVTDYQPTRRFGFKSISKTPVSYEGNILLEPNGRGTRVTLKADIGLRGIWKVAEPLFGFEVRKGINEELKTLKSVLEQGAS
jgi:uncharacterized membrane protein